MNNNPPLVSIGLPVYNGENYIEQCISSILSQTYKNIELIISDNASTDNTRKIVEEFQLNDPRIIISVNEINLGAQLNYDKTVHLAKGSFFKWMAHDDYIYPTFIEECVNLLLKKPELVYCQSLIEFTDDALNSIGIHKGMSDQDMHSKSAHRFRDLILKPHPCMDVFGVFRIQYLGNSLLHGGYPGSDRAYLAEMAMKGPAGFIDKPLIKIREHDNRYTQSIFSIKQKLQWFNTTKKQNIFSPTMALYKDYMHIIKTHSDSWRTRLQCYSYLIMWWFTNWNAIRVVVDFLDHLFPNFLLKAEKLKQKFISPAPRHRYK